MPSMGLGQEVGKAHSVLSMGCVWLLQPLRHPRTSYQPYKTGFISIWGNGGPHFQT